jgi:hypothetical protein
MYGALTVKIATNYQLRSSDASRKPEIVGKGQKFSRLKRIKSLFDDRINVGGIYKTVLLNH